MAMNDSADERLTNDELAQPSPRYRTPMRRPTGNQVAGIIVGTVLAAGLIVGGSIEGPALAASIAHAQYLTAQAKIQAEAPAAPIGDATTGDEEQTLADSDTAGGQAIATEQAALQAQAAAEAAAEAAAAQAAADRARAASNGGKHPAGTPLPFIPSSDPNNANGGDYEDPGTFCESGSASTVNGVPVCD